MSKTLGVALGSGGARGIAHIGFLQALEEEGVVPDYIAGCSMGAVVGGAYASGMEPAKIKEIALKLKMRDLVDVSPALISKMSILRGHKLRDLLREYLGEMQIEDMKIPFKCVATELYSGRLHVFESGSAALAIQASSTIPSIFRPVKHDGMLFVDGGCLCRVPVKTVKEMGADVVVAVDVLKNTAEPVEKLPNIFSMIMRLFDVMDNNQTLLTRCVEKDLCDLLVTPEIFGMNQYVIKNLDKAYDEGYEEGKKHVSEIRELLK